MPKKRVLFICTHNSARSQMAECFLRHIGGEEFDVHSAGTDATDVRPMAIQVMGEMGVDISGQSSKTFQQFLNEPWDYVITVCDDANESCPVFPGGRQRLHWSFPDPSKVSGTDEQKLAAYRDVRDQIDQRVRDFAASISSGAGLLLNSANNATS